MTTTQLVSEDPIARIVEGQVWISPSQEINAQKWIRKPFENMGGSGAAMLSFLHGEWLHEPLHAVLTDIPVGAWTVTIAADVLSGGFGCTSMNKAADVSLAIGLAGAVGAAVTGLVDWSEIDRPAPRRIGAAHALLNVGATTLFAASCFTRSGGHRRSLSRSLAVAGYLLIAVSAHLGGNLVYEHGVGVRK